MSDLHIRVLRAIARSTRRRLADDRVRGGEETAGASARARELERRSQHADTQLAAAEERRRGGARADEP